MKKKKIVIPENYLDRIPVRAPTVDWDSDSDGSVVLKIENTGWVNRIVQKLFFRPKFSYIHLDSFGSFIWPLIDGQTSILELGKAVEERFGEEAHPLYERLAQYFRILDSYSFITWK